MLMRQVEVVVVGASWGGIEAVIRLLQQVPRGFSPAIILVLHRHTDSQTGLEKSLRRYCVLPVHEVEDKDVLQAGSVFVAPANYHLLLERDRSFSLCVSAPVHYSRPSIDVSMESISEVFGAATIGVLLTGANEDGSEGMAIIKKMGGLTIAQDPNEAAAPTMPRSAIERGSVDVILPLEQIIPYICGVLEGRQECNA